ncbi:BTAD domain-containing putative transcriptional regulator [Lysinibacillus sp. NPDC096418]|uniref:BTAD domain-containing putative transcriptional regulator n=1 Tax=Lysinibacillus sp. NPDC096418 TaxID=3364138 RepID=UPI00381287BE
MKKLKKSLDHTCTFIHSGAGYGKTTLLAQFLHSENIPFSWYTVTEEDDNILPFIRYVTHSIQRVIPTFGEDLELWNRLSRFPKIEELNRLYKLFINSLCTIQGPFIIVIDDYHLVDHEFHINYVLDKIIEFAPPNIHLIIASRSFPNWDILRKLKLQMKLLMISEKDLVFSAEEISVFFEDYVAVHLTEDELMNVLEITEGWAISISLLAEQWQNDPIERWLTIQTTDLFSYLSEDVFAKMTTLEQQALLYFAIFPTFSDDLIRQFYNQEVADQLELLLSRHLFIQPITPNGLYRFHSLFSKFLEMKWQQDQTQFIRLHKKAALYFSTQDNVHAVLHHAFKTEDINFCGELLQKNAESVVKAGQFEWLLEKINRFSVNEKQKYYPLYYFEGECHRFRAYYEKAKNAYEACIILASEACDSLYMTKAHAGLAHIYLDTIQPALAEPYLIQALEHANHTTLSLKEHLELQRQYAENLVNLGKANQASHFIEAVALDEEILQRANVDVRILLRTGKLHEAIILLAKRLEGPAQMLATHRESELLASFVHGLLGEAKEAWHTAQIGIRRGVREKSAFIEAVGYLRKGSALLLFDFPDYEGAYLAYEKAIALMNTINISRVKAEPYMGLAIVKYETGDRLAAKKYLALGLHETEQVHDAWMSALILLVEVKITVSENDLEKAKQLLLKAKMQFQECGDKNGEMHVYFYQSVIASKEQNTQAFSIYFKQFASSCITQGYEYFFQRRTMLGPSNLAVFLELLQYSVQNDIDSSAIKIIKSYFSVDRNLIYPSCEIQVNFFGSLSLSRDHHQCEDKEWQRDKAKDLFVYLYCNRHRYIPKEEIAHALWPDRLVDSLDRDFKVILNALLKVLEPTRSARQDSYFIHRKNNMYQLRHIHFLQIDVERFLYYYQLGMEELDPYISNEWLHLAETCYKGALYAEKKQLDWIVQDREKFQTLYLEVLEKLAQNAIHQQNYKQAIVYAEKMIREDSLWEEGYRLLMYSYFQLNNRPLALKWYEKCVQQLHKELNTTPMESTMAIYDLIIQN